MERRLATILVADVVGYSRLMGADEVGTLRHFNVLRQDFIEPLIGQHRGRVVKLMGDGLLVEFSSVVAAVECAMAWQEGVAARAGEVPPDKQIRFRIGINLGDVIVENDDLFGDGVNVAARLEAMALPGGICLSDDAQRQARGKVDAIFEDLGAKELKNIAEPLRVFRVVMEGAADIASDDTAAPAPVGQPTLAAVPFRHLGDPAQSYITEGLTETLGTALSLFEEFDFVGAPTVNGPHQPSFLLDGSVQILGSRVRISVQLSETASGRKVWGKTLDHTTEDVFAMQDEVVGIVASTMGEAIWEEGARALAAKPQDRYTPYDWTLDGIQHLHRNDPSENHAARDSLEKALAMAPELPVALIGVGWTYTTELVNGWPTDRTDAYDYCVDIAKDLLTRNERYDQAHRLLARLYHFAGQHDEALKHSKRAYDINPYNSDLIVSYGLSLVYTGAAAEGVGYIERGCRINPYAPAYYQAYLALGYFLSGRYDEAVARLRGLERPIGSSRLFLAASLAALGRLDEARGELSAHRAEHPEVSLEVIAGSIPLKEESDRAAYLGALAKAGLPGRAAAELVETTVFEPPDTPSIAVLPFDNMSGDKEQDYFADGITEDIITEISKVSGLMVISRNSTFTYKGKAAKVQDVCRDLGVRYILEGSVRKAGERVRITAQLIDGRSGGHLWAERYDCKLEDIFAVQDDVTDKIVRALEVKLVGSAGAHAARAETDIPEAYDCVLRGREQYRLFSADSNIAARQLFEQAIALDPDYATPYAGLAETFVQDWFMGAQPALDRAFELAQQAKARNPSLPLVQEALSTVQLFKKQNAEAISTARRWIEIEPSNADAYTTLAGALHFAGENEEVIAMVEKATRLNPFYPFYYPHYIGLANMAMRRFDEAVVAFKRSIVRNPEAFPPHFCLAACYGHLGDREHAAAHLAEVRRINPGFSIAWLQTFMPYKRAADLGLLVDGLQKAGLSG